MLTSPAAPRPILSSQRLAGEVLFTASVLIALGCHTTPLKGPRLDGAADGTATPATDANPVVDAAPEIDAPTVIAGASIFASGQVSPGALAMDGTNLYWYNFGISWVAGPKVQGWSGGQVMKCAKSGCADGPTTLASDRANGFTSPFVLATDGADVVWFDSGVDSASGTQDFVGGIFRCPVVGCGNAPERISDSGASALAVAAGNVYWTVYSGELLTCPFSGCASAPLALWSIVDETSTTLAVDVALDGTDVYWTTLGLVMRCGLAGCNNAPTVLVSDAAALYSLGPIALDDTNVYFGHGLFADGSIEHPGEIMVCAKTGCGDHPAVLATGVDRPVSIATDGTDVYWAELVTSDLNSSGPGPGMIRRCSVAGCNDTPTMIAAGLAEPISVAVDDQYVYWTESGASNTGNDGRIWRAPK